MMKILVACEESGAVRDQFRLRGHDAVSLDVLPTSTPGPHRQEPLTESVLAEGWDLIVAFPPCTRLSAIGSRWWKRWQENGEQTAAAAFVKMIWDAPCESVAIENPIGWLNTNWMKPSQIVDPWQFGDPYRKRTCLWLRGLPALRPEVAEMPADVRYYVTGQRRSLGGPRRYDPNEAGDNRRGGGAAVSCMRSKTFPGIARAMAETWSP